MRAFLMMVVGVLTVTAAGDVYGSDLTDRLRAAGDGTVRFSFEAREGVWGDGKNRIFTNSWRGDGDWCRNCEPGPVRVELELEQGRVVDLEGWVGGRWRGSADTDLGEVSSTEAADYLLGLAREARRSVAEEAVALAPMAAGVVLWRELRDLALDGSVNDEVREDAVFWLGQTDDDEALAALDRIYDGVGDEDLQEQVIFAYSQRSESAALDRLMHIARHDPDSELREKAIFWLGQSDDPRAIALIERLILD